MIIRDVIKLFLCTLFQSDVYLWLVDLRLGEYWPNFVDNTCTEPTDLEDLKTRSKDQLKTEYKVTKMAHLNMLHKAIQKLKYANQGMKRNRFHYT